MFLMFWCTMGVSFSTFKYTGCAKIIQGVTWKKIILISRFQYQLFTIFCVTVWALPPPASPLFILNGHLCGSKQIWNKNTNARHTTVKSKWNCSLNFPMVKYTGWPRLDIFQQKRVTNMVTSQNNTTYFLSAWK